jgi:hypothetical protein
MAEWLKHTVRYGMVFAMTGCSHALTDDAVVLVERPDDWEQTEAGAAQFRPHIGVSVTVTDDPARYHSWPTEERWRLDWVPKGYEVRTDDDVAVVCPDEGPKTLAVTDRTRKRIVIGPCFKGDTKLGVVIAHEVGHMVGAGHCTEGVMREETSRTIVPSSETIKELRALYD